MISFLIKFQKYFDWILVGSDRFAEHKIEHQLNYFSSTWLILIGFDMLIIPQLTGLGKDKLIMWENESCTQFECV